MYIMIFYLLISVNDSCLPFLEGLFLRRVYYTYGKISAFSYQNAI